LQDAGELYSRYGFDIRRALPGGMTFNAPTGLELGLSVIRAGRVPALRRQVARSRGRSLTERIKDIGGIVDTGGELSAMNAPSGVIRPDAEAMGDILGGPSDNQFMPDSMTLRLWEEGYFPEFQDRPEPNDLFAAISDELGGMARYGEMDTSQTDQAMVRAQELIDLAEVLDQLGLDPATMDDAAIAAALEEATNADPDTAAFYQELVSRQYAEPEERELNQGVENKRGSIKLANGKTINNLFEKADLSTLLHESGHFFIEVTRDLAMMDEQRATDAEGNQYGLRGDPLPANSLAVANVGDDGNIYVGKPRGLHFEIDRPDGVEWADTGFITPQGEYLNREQALAWTEEQGASVRPSENMGQSLDALDYREQVNVSTEQQARPVNTLADDWNAI